MSIALYRRLFLAIEIELSQTLWRVRCLWEVVAEKNVEVHKD